MAQPPGNATYPRPYLASNGPNTRTQARILRTYSNDASVVSLLVASTVTVLFSNPTSAFIFLSTSLIVYTSAITGTSLMTLLPSLAIILAAMTGSTAFLAPEI